MVPGTQEGGPVWNHTLRDIVCGRITGGRHKGAVPGSSPERLRLGLRVNP